LQRACNERITLADATGGAEYACCPGTVESGRRLRI
jgi:hypothetical protein